MGDMNVMEATSEETPKLKPELKPVVKILSIEGQLFWEDFHAYLQEAFHNRWYKQYISKPFQTIDGDPARPS